MIFGTTYRNKQARFSGEIPEELIEKTRARDWKKPEPGYKAPPSNYETRIKSANAARHFGQAVPSSQVGKQTFQVGDSVSHKTFGTGTILSATPMGNDVLLEIAFDQAGTKKLMSNFARLTKK